MYETAGPEHLKRHRRTLEAAARKGMVRRLPALHAEAFSRIDCLACARCCSGYSPRFRPPDVRRVARAVGMAVPAFEQKYLTTDEDEDWVAKTAPCPFLQADRCCQVYEDRPTDCARYPYTDSEVLLKRPALTLKKRPDLPRRALRAHKVGGGGGVRESKRLLLPIGAGSADVVDCDGVALYSIKHDGQFAYG